MSERPDTSRGLIAWMEGQGVEVLPLLPTGEAFEVDGDRLSISPNSPRPLARRSRSYGEEPREGEAEEADEAVEVERPLVLLRAGYSSSTMGRSYPSVSGAAHWSTVRPPRGWPQLGSGLVHICPTNPRILFFTFPWPDTESCFLSPSQGLDAVDWDEDEDEDAPLEGNRIGRFYDELEDSFNFAKSRAERRDLLPIRLETVSELRTRTEVTFDELVDQVPPTSSASMMESLRSIASLKAQLKRQKRAMEMSLKTDTKGAIEGLKELVDKKVISDLRFDLTINRIPAKVSFKIDDMVVEDQEGGRWRVPNLVVKTSLRESTYPGLFTEEDDGRLERHPHPHAVIACWGELEEHKEKNLQILQETWNKEGVADYVRFLKSFVCTFHGEDEQSGRYADWSQWCNPEEGE